MTWRENPSSVHDCTKVSFVSSCVDKLWFWSTTHTMITQSGKHVIQFTSVFVLMMILITILFSEKNWKISQAHSYNHMINVLGLFEYFSSRNPSYILYREFLYLVVLWDLVGRLNYDSLILKKGIFRTFRISKTLHQN